MSTVILYTNRSQINPALYCHFTQYGCKFTQTSHILTAGAKIFAALPWDGGGVLPGPPALCVCKGSLGLQTAHHGHDGRVQYALWLLAAARLLIPGTLFTAPVSVMGAAEDIRISIRETYPDPGLEPSSPPAADPRDGSGRIRGPGCARDVPRP